MSSSSASELLVAAVLLASTSVARAEDKSFSLANSTYLNFTAENRDADLELGLKINLATSDLKPDLTAPAPDDNVVTSFIIRPYIRAPEDDAEVVRIDSQSRTAQAGLALDYLREDAGAADATASSTSRVSLAAEFGTKRYSFTPIGAMDATHQQHQSFTGSLEGVLALMSGSSKDGATMFFPQLALSYSRAYEEAQKRSFVVPGENGGPDTVTTRIVDAPSATPTMSVRAGSTFYVGGPLAFGVFGVANLSGDGYKPWGDGHVVRGELWTYWYPGASVNNRVGFAVFFESAKESADSEADNALGLLLRFKLNAYTLDY
jgi:hypothetical protein